ncbi:hypothetical protein ACB092_01G287200 [Castanea dentata]
MYIITRMNLHQLEHVLFVWLVVRGNWSFSHNIFCLFHACVGLILPSLAKLRTMYSKGVQVRGKNIKKWKT